MLRYRESLGLLPSFRSTAAMRPRAREPLGRSRRQRQGTQPAAAPPANGRPAGTHRRYGEAELRAVAAAIRLESRYDVSPKALAFALRAATEPQIAAEVRELGRLCGRLPSELAALDFEQQKAQRLLRPEITGARRAR